MPSPSIHLYYSPGACSLASHILLHSIPHPFKFTTTKLDSRAGYPEDFRRLNPKMRVPVLTIGDTTVTETPAIMTAISQLAPEMHLMGSTDIETVRVYEWLNWLSGTVHAQGFGGLFRPQRFVDDDGLFPAVRAKARRTVGECFALIEGDLKGEQWAVGDQFTAVDAFLYVLFRWGKEVGIDMEGLYPKYMALAGRVVGREGVKKVLREEGVASYVVGV